MIYEQQTFAAALCMCVCHSDCWAAADMAPLCDICNDDCHAIFKLHCCATAHAEKYICAGCALNSSDHHLHKYSKIIKDQRQTLLVCYLYRCPYCKRANPTTCLDENGVRWHERHYAWSGAVHTWWQSELGKHAQCSAQHSSPCVFLSFCIRRMGLDLPRGQELLAQPLGGKPIV